MKVQEMKTADRQVRQYLSQVRRLEQTLAWKKEQIAALRDMATSATSKLSDMPRSDTPNVHRMESLICKITDLEREAQADCVALETMRIRIAMAVMNLPNTLHQQLLTERYLQNRSWKDIANVLGYSTSHVFRLHDEALCSMQALMTKGEMCQ